MKDGSKSSQNSEFPVGISQKRYPYSKNGVIGRQLEAVVDALTAINERLTLIERRQIMLFAGRGGDLEGREFGDASSENRGELSGVSGVDAARFSGRRVKKTGRGENSAAENDCRGARGFIGLEKRNAEFARKTASAGSGLKSSAGRDIDGAAKNELSAGRGVDADATEKSIGDYRAAVENRGGRSENGARGGEFDAESDDKKESLRQMIADFCKVNSTSWKKGTANKWSCFLARVADVYAVAGDFNGDFFESFKTGMEKFKHGTRVLYWGRLRLFLEFLVEYHEFDKKILRFIPKPRSVGGEIGGDKGVLTREMVEKIAAVTDNEELKDYLTLAVNTGMRSGEILALRAEDITKVNGELCYSVNKTARGAGDGGLDGGCKTASSYRTRPLNAAAAAVVLKRAKKGGFLFATRGGNYHTSTSFLHDDFKKACEICGFSPLLRLYNTRAGFTQDSLDGAKDKESFNRAAKETAKNLGHASVMTTMSSYNKIA